MPDYRSYFDSEWVKAWDLNDKPRTVIIAKVERGSAYDQKSRGKKAMPILWFKGAKKPFGANKTNCKTLATLYGRDTSEWVGKSIEIYPTTTQVGGDSDVPCIRMRAPKGVGSPLPERIPTEEEIKESEEHGALGPDDEIPRCEDGKCGVCSWCVAVAKDMEASQSDDR